MLSKTIKLGLTLVAAALFVAGCASTSETADTGSNNASTQDTAVTEVSSQPSQQNSVEVTESLGTIFYFDFDQASLLPETRSLLSAHATRLKANPRSVRLEGHADERGTREYNIALGERRAIAIRDFLLLQGVTSSIEVVSYGEERPANASSNESAWSLNRRVELK